MREFDLGAVTAYALAVKNGFQGSEQEWLTSLIPELSVGEVKTLEAGSDAAANIGGTPEKPVLNLSLPRGESGHAADWNQNDPTQPDYVKNRPFYEDSGREVPAAGAWTEIDEGKYVFAFSAPLGLEVGKTYVLNWDGTDYICAAQDASAVLAGTVVLGNGSGVGLASNDEPFMLAEYSDADVIAEFGGCGAIQSMDYSGDIPFSIRWGGTVIVPIPGKFLPEGMGYVENEEMVEILPETTVTLESGEGLIADAIPLTIGETYIVNWNGTEYVCEAQDASAVRAGVVFVGNGTGMGLAGNGEPFVVAVLPGTGTVVMADTTDTEATLSVAGGGVTVHKLDNRCLDLEWLPIAESPLLVEEGTVNTGTTLEDRRLPGFGTADFPAGTNVIVAVDGVYYPVTVIEAGSGADGLTLAGNLAIMSTGNPDTGEPFCAMLSDDRAWFYFAEDLVPHKVAVYGEPAPNKLPAEFLPDEAVQNGDTELYLTSSGGKKFKITVSDEGVLSAAEVTE